MKASRHSAAGLLIEDDMPGREIAERSPSSEE